MTDEAQGVEGGDVSETEREQVARLVNDILNRAAPSDKQRYDWDELSDGDQAFCIVEADRILDFLNRDTPLEERINLQTGGSRTATDDEWEDFERVQENALNKLSYVGGAVDFGAPVTVVFDWGEDPDDDWEHEEYGYLTTLPGYDHEGPDMAGVIHLPHTMGEKCDAGPVWMTVADMAALPHVKRIEIGRRPRGADRGQP